MASIHPASLGNSNRILSQRGLDLIVVALRRAVVIVSKVLRNVAAGSVLSSFFAVLFSHGNIFTPVRSQSFDTFVGSNAASFIVVYAIITVVFLSTTLLNETFTAAPALTRSQKLLLCCRTLAWRMSGHVALASISCFFFVYHVTFNAYQTKLGMYFTGLCGCYVTICADVHARHVIKTMTVRGQARELRREEQRKQRQLEAEHENLNLSPASKCRKMRTKQTNGSARIRKRAQRVSFRYALRIALLDTPLVIFVFLSIGYVHVIMLLLDISQQWQFAVFTVCSMALKIGTQETMKSAILKQSRSPPKRLVFVLIATPTILIETQIRVYQLRLGTNSVKLLSIIVIALVEIVVRVLKLIAVKKEVGGRILASATRIMPAKAASERKRENYASKSARFLHPPTSTASSSADNELITKLIMFHTAETYADMYAEYIALGCSYAMFVCFSEHRYFAFDAGSEDTSYSRGDYWLILLLQITIEVIVDTVACMFEILLGIHFEDFNQDDWFVMVLMVSLACQNTAMFSGLNAKMSGISKG